MSELFSMQDKLLTAQRELDKRLSVYPRLIDAGKLTKKRADLEIAKMRAIVEDYARAAQGETLFPLSECPKCGAQLPTPAPARCPVEAA